MDSKKKSKFAFQEDTIQDYESNTESVNTLKSSKVVRRETDDLHMPIESKEEDPKDSEMKPDEGQELHTKVLSSPSIL